MEKSGCPMCRLTTETMHNLNCGHRICKLCSIKIAGTQPDGSVICVVCGDITIVKDDITPEPINARMCDWCKMAEKAEADWRPATKSCWHCKTVFCDDCEPAHSELMVDGSDEIHTVTRISTIQFCPTHPANFIVSICFDCDTGLCMICQLRHPKDGHRRIPLQRAAKDAKKDLQTKACQNQEESPEWLDKMIKYLEKEKGLIDQMTTEATLGLEKLKRKMKESKDSAQEKINTELKIAKEKLDKHRAWVKEHSCMSKEDRKFLQKLLNASDAEVYFTCREQCKKHENAPPKSGGIDDYIIGFPRISKLTTAKRFFNDTEASMTVSIRKISTAELRDAFTSPRKSALVTQPIPEENVTKGRIDSKVKRDCLPDTPASPDKKVRISGQAMLKAEIATPPHFKAGSKRSLSFSPTAENIDVFKIPNGPPLSSSSAELKAATRLRGVSNAEDGQGGSLTEQILTSNPSWIPNDEGSTTKQYLDFDATVDLVPTPIAGPRPLVMYDDIFEMPSATTRVGSESFQRCIQASSISDEEKAVAKDEDADAPMSGICDGSETAVDPELILSQIESDAQTDHSSSSPKTMKLQEIGP